MKKIKSYSILFLIIVINLTPILAFSQSNDLSKDQWIEDLYYVVSNLKEHHPHLYYRVSEEEFNKSVSTAEKEIINSNNNLEAFMAIKRLVAKVQDGHTQVWDTGLLGIEILRFPFRIDKFTDGVFITTIRKEYQKYFGAKVIKMNGIAIDKIIEQTSKISNIDNEFGKIRPSIQDITFARTLVGLGIIDNENQMRLLVEKDGKQEEFIIKSVSDDSRILWSNRVEMAPTKGEYINVSSILKENTPLHLLKQDEDFIFYWFKHLKEENALYFQYNQVWASQPNAAETWLEFTKRIWKYIDENDIQKLIIDVRYNDGGNGRTMIPFINEIIKRDRFCNGENLYVIVGNRTYSAAVIFMTELAVHTNAIFVGTPPSSPFNFFSDKVQYKNLPNSGAALGIASRQIDNAWSNQTVYFSPDIPAPFSSEDYFSGKDPALEMALKGNIISVAEFTAMNGAEKGKQYLQELKDKFTDCSWWIPLHKKNLESNLNNEGYKYMGNGQMTKAYEVFRLNTIVSPESFNAWDSFAEWYLNNNEYKSAIKYYKKSLELNPNNNNAIKKINQIKSGKL